MDDATRAAIERLITAMVECEGREEAAIDRLSDDDRDLIDAYIAAKPATRH